MSSSASKEVVVSDEPWLAYPSPPLVPFSLSSLPNGGLQQVGVATRSGVVCNGFDVTGKCAISVVVLINDRW